MTHEPSWLPIIEVERPVSASRSRNVQQDVRRRRSRSLPSLPSSKRPPVILLPWHAVNTTEAGSTDFQYSQRGHDSSTSSANRLSVDSQAATELGSIQYEEPSEPGIENDSTLVGIIRLDNGLHEEILSEPSLSSKAVQLGTADVGSKHEKECFVFKSWLQEFNGHDHRPIEQLQGPQPLKNDLSDLEQTLAIQPTPTPAATRLQGHRTDDIQEDTDSVPENLAIGKPDDFEKPRTIQPIPIIKVENAHAAPNTQEHGRGSTACVEEHLIPDEVKGPKADEGKVDSKDDWTEAVERGGMTVTKPGLVQRNTDTELATTTRAKQRTYSSLAIDALIAELRLDPSKPRCSARFGGNGPCGVQIKRTSATEAIERLRDIKRLEDPFDEDFLNQELLGVARLLICIRKNVRHGDRTREVVAAWVAILSFDAETEKTALSSIIDTTFAPTMYATDPFRLFCPYKPETLKVTNIERVRQIIESRLTEKDDKDGYIYTYSVLGTYGHIKIGISGDIDQRMRGWRNQCKREPVRHYPPKDETLAPIPHPKRLEKIVSAELRIHQRKEKRCRGCGRGHEEWYEMSTAEAIPTIEAWTAWMRTEPYENEAGQWVLKQSHKKYLDELLNGVNDRLGDIERSRASRSRAIRRSSADSRSPSQRPSPTPTQASSHRPRSISSTTSPRRSSRIQNRSVSQPDRPEMPHTFSDQFLQVEASLRVTRSQSAASGLGRRVGSVREAESSKKASSLSSGIAQGRTRRVTRSQSAAAACIGGR